MQRFNFSSVLGISFVLLSFYAATSFALAADCNGNGVEDRGDLSTGGSDDCNENGIPDECEQTVFNLKRTDATITLGMAPQFSAAEDLDGDGDLDVAVATGRISTPNLSGFNLYFSKI